MTPALCRPVREYLAAVRSGKPALANPDVWNALVKHGAITGGPASPNITPVGEHVLRELEVRAARTDGLPLELVAGQLDRVIQDLDHVAKTAEYFLAELGPVTPPDAVAYLRPVAVGLANRRETPEELAEEFRNIWGSVEVMGGTTPDRLLAAELLNATDADISTIYAPTMITVSRIREKFGEATSAVSAAAILHLHPRADGSPALDDFYALRGPIGSDEAAALLAGRFPDPATAVSRRDAVARGLIAAGFHDSHDLRHAAAFLIAGNGDPQQQIARMVPIAQGLRARLTMTITASAILADLTALDPPELLNWWEKAFGIVESWKLAPTDAEKAVLALALVHGLPRTEFQTGPPESNVPNVSLKALVALDAWVYRPLNPVATREAAPAA